MYLSIGFIVNRFGPLTTTFPGEEYLVDVLILLAFPEYAAYESPEITPTNWDPSLTGTMSRKS